jgi:hypothetical protein
VKEAMVGPHQNAERRRRVPRAVFAVVGALGLVGVFGAVTAYTAQSSGASSSVAGGKVVAVQVATDPSPQTFTTTTWTDLAGAKVTVPGPSSGTDFADIRLSGSGICAPHQSSPGWCSVRILVDGALAAPEDSSCTGIVPTGQPQGTFDDGESFFIERTSAPFGPGMHTVKAQVTLCAGAPPQQTPTSFQPCHWNLTADIVKLS